MIREKTKPGGSIVADDLVKELVHQFSETLSFYRELIQNSIDAGANRIDVSLEYDETLGRAIMRVEDDGDGMNEHIIDNYLIVLFRSTKDDDLTKIGKFGIGFVSVFAPKPQLVRVTTARDGESWRLDFHSVKRFDKFKMPRPRDGTMVELFKEMPREQFDELVVESRATVRYWCRHSETRITFRNLNGGLLETINESFELEGGATLKYEEEGSLIVMGPAWTPLPSYGFYNRGLTLKEGEESFVPFVRFKVKSRFLEHTLTRDNVVRDENFSKAMKLVRKLAADELPEKALAECRALAAELSKALGAGDAAACKRLAEDWGRRLPYLMGLFAQWRRYFKDWDEEPILPGVGGRAVSVKEAKAGARAGGALFVDALRTPVSDALDRAGQPVLYGLWGSEIARMIGARRCLSASSSFIMPQLVKKPEPALSTLLARVNAVDASSAYRYARVAAAEFAYPGSSISERLFVIQNEAGALSPADEKPRSSFFWLGRKRRCAVLNAAHPFVRRLCALHAQRPGLAVFLLLKTLHLHDGEVPARQREKFSALAEQTEKRLLAEALKIDAGSSA